jgi:hypothetical protein
MVLGGGVGTSARRIIGAAAVLAMVGIGLAALLSTVEVVDKGEDLRPYESGKVFQIEVADSFTFFADAESRVRPDLATGAALIILATVALMAAALLRASGAERRLWHFYGLAGLGCAYLAIDELVAVHETVGHNLAFLADIPGVAHPDDVIFGLYIVPALVFAVWFRDVLTSSRVAARLFVAAGVGFLGAGLADLTPTGLLDETLELIVALCVGTGFMVLVATHLAAPRFGRAPLVVQEPAAPPDRVLVTGRT